MAGAVKQKPLFHHELQALIKAKQAKDPKFVQADLAGIVGVSQTLMSFWVNGTREINRPKRTYAKKLIAFAKKVRRYKAERLVQAIAALPLLEAATGRQGPRPLKRERVSKWSSDFRELFSMTKLTQAEFAARVRVNPSVVGNALHNRTAKFQTMPLVKIVKFERTIRPEGISKMEKYLPFHRRDVSDRELLRRDIRPFVKLMNPIMDVADEQGMKAVAAARFLGVQPLQMSYLATGKCEPSRRTCVRLLKLEEKLDRTGVSELPKYYQKRFGDLPNRRAR